MKITHFIFLLFSVFSFWSCENERVEIEEINQFLKVNTTFNAVTLNHYSSRYFLLKEEQPEKANVELDQLYPQYKKVISTIDNAIKDKDYSKEALLITEYQKMTTALNKLVHHNKDYAVPELPIRKYDKTFLLLNMKNRLIIGMSYALEYYSYQPTACGARIVDHVDTKISQDHNQVKITLHNDVVQKNSKNRHLFIDRIEHNGKQKKNRLYDTRKSLFFGHSLGLS